jgi:hypothetical protein
LQQLQQHTVSVMCSTHRNPPCAAAPAGCFTPQARNVLLKSAGGDARGFVAKVSDFGLSMRIDPTETHVSNFYQGTLTHMVRGHGVCWHVF